MNLLKRILKNKLFNNIFYLFLLQGFGYIFPILLIPFLISTIGIEKYGLVNFAFVFAWYFQVVSELGFELSNVKHVVANINNSNKLSEVFSVVITIRFVFALILFVIYISIICYFPKFREDFYLYLIAYVRVFTTAFLPYWLFRSLENVKEITKISLFARTISILPMFLFVKEENDYVWVISFMSLNEFIAAILTMNKAIKTYHLQLSFYSFNRYLYYIKDTIPFFTSYILIRLYTNSNILILGFFSNPFWTGIYSVSEKLYHVYGSMIMPLLQHVFYPYFMRIKNILKINKMVIILSIGNIILVLFIYLVAPYILPLFIKSDMLIIHHCFNLFLVLMCIDMPVNLLGYPYSGVTNNIQKLNKSTFSIALFYCFGVIIMLVFNLLSVNSMIVLLIITQLVSLIYRCCLLKDSLFIKLK